MIITRPIIQIRLASYSKLAKTTVPTTNFSSYQAGVTQLSKTASGPHSAMTSSDLASSEQYGEDSCLAESGSS